MANRAEQNATRFCCLAAVFEIDLRAVCFKRLCSFLFVGDLSVTASPLGLNDGHCDIRAIVCFSHSERESVDCNRRASNGILLLVLR